MTVLEDHRLQNNREGSGVVVDDDDDDDGCFAKGH